MTKKILAGVLACVSMLSLSATAFATSSDTSSATSDDGTSAFTGGANGPTYNITAPVDYGTVDVTVPKAMDKVVINPYGAAIKTGTGATAAKNTNFVASLVYEIVNNSTEDSIKVYATTSVSKATGLVVVDADATQPDGWATAVDAKDTTKVVNQGQTWNKLYTYDKITAKTDKTSGVTTYTGGGLSAKQANNVAIEVIGVNGASATPATASSLTAATAPAGMKSVAFHAKGTNTGELGTAGVAESVYYTVKGELSDKAPAADPAYSWGKETLAISVVLKIIPVTA